MTGILIFTAGREDAFEDYQRSVKEGHRFDEVEAYLPGEEFATLREKYEGKTAHFWGTSVKSKWKKVESSDIALIYRDGHYIAQARVVHTCTNLELAEAVWNVERNPWDESSPWKHLTFVTDVEEIDIDAGAFNELVDYEPSYRPQGFTRVADYRIRELEDHADSVETAVANLTGAGIRVHEVDDNIENNDKENAFIDQLIAASKNGGRAEEFEQLVAKAFTRLGCETKWIEGGGDTDVEITSPVHTIVEAKARSSSRGVNNINATRVDSHRQQHSAEHAIVVSRYFPPGAIEDAEANNLTTLTVERLARILELRDQYGIPPEKIFELLIQSGAFQDDRMDLLAESVQERLKATETILDVIEALEHADENVQTADDLRWIIIGMSDPESAPTKATIEDTLKYLEHPSFRIVKHNEDGYHLQTNYSNALRVLRTTPSLFTEAEDCRKESE